jgi:hypothetical protein
MNKNQLFKDIPSKDLCLKIIKAFGLKDFNDERSFTRDDITRLETLSIFNNSLKEELMNYYLPCKQRTYLNDLNTKNIITVLRHICKVNGYSVFSTEKHVKKAKLIVYKIVKITSIEYKPLEKEENSVNDGIVEFD